MPDETGRGTDAAQANGWPSWAVIVLILALGGGFGYMIVSTGLLATLGLCPAVYVTSEPDELPGSRRIEVENNSSEPMTHLAITVNGVRPATMFAERLIPGGKVTLGQVELRHVLQSGDIIKIDADGFAFGHRFSVR